MHLKPRVKAPSPELIGDTQEVLQRHSLNTVCIASRCPNIGECFFRGTATFMILGDRCTRNCKFCSVAHARPLPPDASEPERIARAVEELGLRYVVITSVDRDDLADFGASHFVRVTEAIRKRTDARIELLTPDFKGDSAALAAVIAAKPHKLAHNIETVRRLHRFIKPGSSYERSLAVLRTYANSGIVTKSSLIVGLGESIEEIEQTLQDLYDAGVRQLTIGQYLQPSKEQLPVQKYYTPEEFAALEAVAKDIGFEAVASGALVRSSYYAERL